MGWFASSSLIGKHRGAPLAKTLAEARTSIEGDQQYRGTGNRDHERTTYQSSAPNSKNIQTRELSRGTLAQRKEKHLNAISFKELNLIDPIQRAIDAEKYTVPTPIQAAAIPHLLAGRDLLGCAQTGTGKTAAFALPILQLIDQNRQPGDSSPRTCLVLSPTRELANQIGRSFEVYGRHLHFRQTVVFGGVNQNPQVRALARGVHVLVATPGRLLDLMGQGHVRLDKLTYFCPGRGGPDARHGILARSTEDCGAAALRDGSRCSFRPRCRRRRGNWRGRSLTNPVRINVTPPASTVDRIEQRVFFVERSKKQALFAVLLGSSGVSRALVFTRTKHGADKVARQLGREGLVADAIHGNKSQNARERTLEQFRRGSVPILVATDLAARGIDVDGVSHVINFDIPHEPESYVHRIGRTGLPGRTAWRYRFAILLSAGRYGPSRNSSGKQSQSRAVIRGPPSDRPVTEGVTRATNGRGVHRSGDRNSHNSNRRKRAHGQNGMAQAAAWQGGRRARSSQE